MADLCRYQPGVMNTNIAINDSLVFRTFSLHVRDNDSLPGLSCHFRVTTELYIGLLYPISTDAIEKLALYQTTSITMFTTAESKDNKPSTAHVHLSI